MQSLHNYREIRPQGRLALGQAVVSAWSQRVDAGNDGYEQVVLPDGYAEIVWRDDNPPVLVGPSSTYRRGVLRAGLRLAGVRLDPGAVTALGVAPSELVDIEVPLGQVVGPGRHAEPLGRPATAELALGVAADLSALRSLPPGPWTAFCVDWLATHPRAMVAELAAELGVSPRQLHRRFLAQVGLGPKRFQRLMRIHRFVGLARRHPELATAALAAVAGFADQAHLGREAVSLAGRTPGELRVDAYSPIPGSVLFNTPSPR